MATTLEQAIAKMVGEDHPLTICRECELQRPIAKVNKHAINILRRKLKLKLNLSAADSDEIAYSGGFCGRACNEAYNSRSVAMDHISRYASCVECAAMIVADKLVDLGTGIPLLFCSEVCLNGFEVRLQLGRRHIIVVRKQGTGMMGGGVVFANGTLRGVEIVANCLGVDQLLVFDVLHRDTPFDRWKGIKSHQAQFYTCVRMVAGSGTMDGPCWADDCVATLAGGREW